MYVKPVICGLNNIFLDECKHDYRYFLDECKHDLYRYFLDECKHD